MEKVQVRFPEDDLEKLRQEVEDGKYPSLREAIRDKVRKCHLLEALVHMSEATEDMDEVEALAALDATRATHHADGDPRTWTKSCIDRIQPSEGRGMDRWRIQLLKSIQNYG